MQYEIETSLFEVLRNDWCAPENQQIALMTYEALFGLQPFASLQSPESNAGFYF